MNLAFLPVALVFGYFIPKRGVAIATYLAADAMLFTYQTSMQVLLGISGHEGSRNAFALRSDGDTFTFGWANFWSYGVVNLLIILISLGALLLAHLLRARRDARRHTLSVG